MHISAREQSETEFRGRESVRAYDADQAILRNRRGLSATATMKEPIDTWIMGVKTVVTPEFAGEFGVALVPQFKKPTWKITSGNAVQSLVDESKLEFVTEPVETRLCSCSQCGRSFMSTTGYSHCEDHYGLSRVD